MILLASAKNTTVNGNMITSEGIQMKGILLCLFLGKSKKIKSVERWSK